MTWVLFLMPNVVIVLKTMEIELSEIEINNLMQMADKNSNGMIEYKEFVPMGKKYISYKYKF